MSKGRYGQFGGQYVPETLMNTLLEIEREYERLKQDREFQEELNALFRDYAGRPSMLYYAKNMTEALGGASDERVLQEVAVFATRIDVAEELTRLNAHLDEVERVLKQGGACGKRLDFLMQELNREANTLGSKSAITEVSQASMELKLLIEQMREQIQNLE